MCRVTDFATVCGSQHDFQTNNGGSAQTNIMDVSDTRFWVGCTGQAGMIFSFTPAPTFTRLYANNYLVPDCGGGSIAAYMFFSYTVPKTGYSVSYNASNNASICSYDFTSAVTGPTLGSGITQLVDLSTCVAALAGKGTVPAYLDELEVSGDDQTFAVLAATTSGQDSAGTIYAVVWNRTSGCRAWNTSTGAITGAWGSTGTVNCAACSGTPTFTMHGVRLFKSGNWLDVTPTTSTCSAQCPANTIGFKWDLATLNVYPFINDSTNACGHNAQGYTKWVNKCGNLAQTNDIMIRANNNPGSFTVLPAAFPSPTTNYDTHISWNTDNAIDTAPFFLTWINTTSFSVTGAWENEIGGVATDGSGKVWRFGHHYNTLLSTVFSANQAIGSPSADGRYYFWTTDFDGMLGNDASAVNACIIGVDCATGVFFMALPAAGTSLMPGSKVTSGVSIR